MDQPTIEQVTQLEKRVQHLEDEIVDWQHWKTITRDSAHKIGIAEGLATSLQGDVIQLKVDVAKVSRQVATVILYLCGFIVESTQATKDAKRSLTGAPEKAC